MQAWALALCVLGGTNPFDGYVYDPLVGKAVVVIHDDAEFTTGDGNAGTLAIGEQLNVTAADGDVLIASFAGRAITLQRADVLLPPEAVDFFAEEVKRSPTAGAYFALGTTRQLLLRFEESIPAFDEALKLDPEMAKAYLRRGMAKLQLKDFEAALADLTEVIQRRDQPGSDKTVPYAYLYRVACWQAKGDLEHAISDCSVFLSKNPNYVPVLFTRAKLWASRGDLREARDDFDVAVRLAPEDAELRVNRMRFRQRNRDFAGAVEDGEAAVRLDSQGKYGHAARQLLATLLAGCRDDAVRNVYRAIWHADELLRRDRKSCLTLSIAAAVYAEAGDFNNAVAMQQTAIFLLDKNPQPLLTAAGLNRALLEGQLKRYQKKQSQRDDKEPALLFFRGEQLFVVADSADLHDDEGRNVGTLWSNDVVKLERVDGLRCFVTCGAMGGWVDGRFLRPLGDGIDHCNRALERGITARRYCNRAVLEMGRGDFKHARTDFDKAVSLSRDSAKYLTERSVFRLFSGDIAGASADLEESLRRDPNSGDAYGNRGMLKFTNNDFLGALADLDEAVRLKPEKAIHRSNRAALLMTQLGEYARGLADCDELVRLGSDAQGAMKAHCGRAWYLKRKGLFTEALAELGAAAAGAPDLQDGHSHLAWLLATCPVDELRDGDAALRHAMTACRLTKFGNASALDSLAAAYAELGDFDKAVGWQTTALELAADNEREEFASHLKEYQADRPYRHAPKFEPPAVKLPRNSAKADANEAGDRLSRPCSCTASAAPFREPAELPEATSRSDDRKARST